MLGHMMLANVLGHEMLCSEAEALRIATAYCNLRKHYPALPIDPKTLAWLTMAGALAWVEAPKLRDVAARKRAEREDAKVNRAAAAQAGGGTVVPLDPSQRGERPAMGPH